MPDRDAEIQELRALIAQLTERVYRLEEASSAPPSPAADQKVSAVPVRQGRAQSTEPRPARPLFETIVPSSLRGNNDSAASLENRIGSQWLNRIGIMATLIGVSYFLKYAFENNWIGPLGRVSIGLLAGIAVVIWSERFRTRGYPLFSWSLKAIGVGTMYLSIWAAFQVYHLIPDAVAFGAMVLVTAFTATLALRQDAEVLAALAVVGGFATPLLLSTNENHEVALFSYVALLDLATLAVVTRRPWRRLLAGAYLGTQILFFGWYTRFYNSAQLGLTIFFATVFFAIFLAAPLIARARTEAAGYVSRTLVFISVINAGVYFLELYGMLEDRHQALLAWIAVLLSAIYLVAARYATAAPATLQSRRVLNLIHIALAVGFLTIAIPLKLESQWISFGWLVESAVLLWIAYRVNSGFLKLFSLVSLLLGVFRVVMVDTHGPETTLLFNSRFALYLCAIAATAWAVWLSRDERSEQVQNARGVGAVAVNLLALLALSLEVHDYFQRQLNAIQPVSATRRPYDAANWAEYTRLNRLRDFAYSAVWMLYGAALMWAGFIRRSAFIRWQALVLLAITIGKVFLYDTSALDTPYRVLSFIALGIILLGVSFAYQRDWLKLSARQQGSERA